MKQIFSAGILLLALSFFSMNNVNAQGSTTANKKPVSKTYLIERDIPGAGKLSPADLKGISQKSCAVIKEIGPAIVWLQSYVTGNKVFCVYQAENEALLQEHAKKGGFPVTAITEINSTISPATAE